MEWLAPAIAGVTLLVLLADRLFGGARGLVKELAKLETDMLMAVAEFRNEVQKKREEGIAATGEALTGLRTQMHLQETRHLEFRALAAETYMRWDNYYKASEELKGEMNRGFDKLDKRLERIESSQRPTL